MRIYFAISLLPILALSVFSCKNRNENMNCYELSNKLIVQQINNTIDIINTYFGDNHEYYRSSINLFELGQNCINSIEDENRFKNLYHLLSTELRKTLDSNEYSVIDIILNEAITSKNNNVIKQNILIVINYSLSNFLRRKINGYYSFNYYMPFDKQYNAHYKVGDTIRKDILLAAFNSNKPFFAIVDEDTLKNDKFGPVFTKIATKSGQFTNIGTLFIDNDYKVFFKIQYSVE